MVVDLRLHGLVLLDQVLDTDQIFAPIGGSNDGFLFPDPCLFVLHISEKLLHCQRLHQTLLSAAHGLEEGVVARVETGLFGLNVSRVKMASLEEAGKTYKKFKILLLRKQILLIVGQPRTYLYKLLGSNLDTVHSVLMGTDVRLHESMFLQEVLN